MTNPHGFDGHGSDSTSPWTEGHQGYGSFPSSLTSGSSSMLSYAASSAATQHCQWQSACPATFSDSSALGNHVFESHVYPLSYTACMWRRACWTPIHLDHVIDHVSTQHGLGNNRQHVFVCCWDRCEDSFANKDALEEHMKQVHVYTPLKCEWRGCGTSLEDPSTLSQHVESNHLLSPPPLDGTAFEPSVMQLTTAAVPFSDEAIAAANLLGLTGQAGGDIIMPNWDDPSAEFLSHHDPGLKPFDGGQDIQASPMPGWDERPATFLAQPSSALNTLDITGGSSLHLNITHSESVNQEHPPAGACVCRWQSPAGDGGLQECGATYAREVDLQAHARKTHVGIVGTRSPEKVGGYPCLWHGCGKKGVKVFAQRGKLERHILTHTKYKAYECDICGTDFSSSQGVQQHKRTHTGERPNICKFCGKNFRQSSALTVHLRGHTGEKPLICGFPECGKAFSESSNLSKHRKTHEVPSRHVCQFCDKAFNRRDQLNRHQRHNHPGAVAHPATSANAFMAQFN